MEFLHINPSRMTAPKLWQGTGLPDDRACNDSAIATNPAVNSVLLPGSRLKSGIFWPVLKTMRFCSISPNGAGSR